ncbi:class I SAM-dependent methyltransferase [Methanobacterium alcaliphilum]|uniref:class I SAM-dependent methyltransferase n=1 Tax=Methanobacterium alcaliphilum TaxID=392018 RepID=UPI00200AF878|nr:class I SAM-dependent methyltransferase [Methanobacterium alcaliphilum]MCK9152562.1 class I SAM-dependent methyltransferase [Methanobacterium alcaliphilum]
MDNRAKKELIKEKFSAGANIYDKFRASIIPNLDDLYCVLVELAQSEKNSPKILDLGAGTGLLTKYLLGKYPDAQFQLIDLSEEMLNIARDRFKDFENFEYISADYVKQPFNDSFDIVVSSLSIHHLKHTEKQLLNQKIFKHLNSGGIFINADQITGPCPFSEETYQKNWFNKIDESELDDEYKEPAIERMKFDNPATLDENLKWLKEAGFEDIDVYYKYYNFVVLFGRKK